MASKNKNLKTLAGIFFGLLFIVFFSQVYLAKDIKSNQITAYTLEKGKGLDEISKELEGLGLIKSSYFFKLYVNMSLQRQKLQAGDYNFSPAMSAYHIARKMAKGDVIKNQLIIPEGWDLSEISAYLEKKGVCKKEEFVFLAGKDYSEKFDFLKDKSRDVPLEGFLFPDTYEISQNDKCEKVLTMMLENFGQKLGQGLKDEIAKQDKTIFDIVTMASMIEKEVKSQEDKKIVSGILWKRINIGMPLQLDATVNYVTGKNAPGVAIKDTKIDSPYNTYMYRGLPKGPISNPGIDSITAAIYPKESKYLFYLSAGKTFFSETYEQHLIAKARHLD